MKVHRIKVVPNAASLHLTWLTITALAFGVIALTRGHQRQMPAEPTEVRAGRAVRQTAVLPFVRYTFGLPNFAAHSPEEANATERAVLRASNGRYRRIVPVHSG